MGEVLNQSRRGQGRRNTAALGLGLLALVTLGACASSQPRSAQAPPAERASETETAGPEGAPRQIEDLRLRQGEVSTYVEVLASGPLVWTSYRDSEGNLVIELPNSVPGAAVEDLVPAEGLISSVRVEREDVASRPLTRLTVATRMEADHSLSADGELLAVELAPVETQLAAAERAAPSYEPFSEPEAEEPEVAEINLEPTTGEPGTGAAAAAGPATVLEGIELVSTLEGTVIKVQGDGAFTFSTFQLTEPSRFVIDLAGVVNTSSQSVISVETDDVDRVRLAQFKPFPEPVSRVVFDLRAGEAPRVEATEGGLLVRFGEARQAQIAQVEPVAAPEPMMPEAAAPEAAAPEALPAEMAPEPTEMAAEPAEMESEPADRIAAAEETPEPFEAPGLEEPAQAEPYLPSEPAEPMVAELETETGEEVEEAAPFEEPAVFEEEDFEEEEPLVTSDVAMFEAAQVEYSEPTEERQSLTTTVAGAEIVGGAGQNWTGDPISLSLRDADIKDVLRSFSTITGLNIVVHPGVRGSVTVELSEVPWDQALDLILRINGLDYVLEGNIMRIATTDSLAREAEERRKLAAAQAQEIPLQTVIRSISYADARDIARLLTTSEGGRGGGGRGGRGNRGILSNRGSITVDDRTNKLILKDLPANMTTLLAIIENLDTATPQVLIEARIIETTKQFSRSLGIDWSFNAISDEQFGNTTGLVFPHQGTVGGGVQLLTGGQNGFLDVTMGNLLNTFTLDARLQAAETEGLVSILSAPKIATLDNQRASIQSGLQIPIQTVSNNTVSVQFVNATLELQVTPQVTAEGTVMLDIQIAKRAPQPALAIAGSPNAPISTKQARTRVIVRDGGTTVIGGIYEVTSDRGEDRVPGLANIPIVGHLFKNKRRNNNNEELLIFLTPRVIQL